MKWLQLAEGDRSKGMLLASEMGSDQEADCIRSDCRCLKTAVAAFGL